VRTAEALQRVVESAWRTLGRYHALVAIKHASPGRGTARPLPQRPRDT
jgi:hypothetical protein